MIPDRQTTTFDPGIHGGGRAPAPRFVLACAIALAASACGDTLVDHDGDRFYVLPCAGQGSHLCDRGTGPVCEPVSARSCGDGLACTDCTAGFLVPNATAICGSAGACGFQCDAGWLRCGTGCCRTLAVAAGGSHTCAIVGQLGDPSGRLKCWGANERGQLGAGGGDYQDRLVPTDVLLMDSGVTLVAAGAAHTCAVKGGALYCWGANSAFGVRDGRLGVTTLADQYSSPQTVSLAGVTALAPGELHTCALVGNAIYCWGANARGQLGSGALGGVRPTPSTPTLTGASAVVSGRANACALVSGAVRCWGANDWGQLGNGAAVPRADQPSPVAAGTLAAVTALAAGAHHSCAVDASPPDPLLWCWGENTDDQLGLGTAGGDSSSPILASVVQSLRPVMAAGGRAHTCGLKADVSGIKCFGSNATGQLGGPGPAEHKIDVQLGNVAAAAISAGDDHGCALDADGSLYCWGANGRGQVGDGSTSPTGVFRPTAVSGR